MPRKVAAKKTLTHIDAKGEARMVDVSEKAVTSRIAVAEGAVVMQKATLDLIVSGNAKKGDVLGTARVAAIMAAKRTHELIPLCHPLLLSKVEVDIATDAKLPGCRVRATVKVSGQTGAEMATVAFDVPRGTVSSWGDDYGNRVDRFLATAAYLDNTGYASVVMARGYYTRTTLTAWFAGNPSFFSSQLAPKVQPPRDVRRLGKRLLPDSHRYPKRELRALKHIGRHYA